MSSSANTFEQAISGQTILKVLVQEYWHRGELVDPCNVILAQLANDRWLRFFFDAGVFFWSEVSSPLLPTSSNDHAYRLSEIELSGMIKNATVFESRNCPVASILTLSFGDGRILHLHNQDDRSRLEIKNEK